MEDNFISSLWSSVCHSNTVRVKHQRREITFLLCLCTFHEHLVNLCEKAWGGKIDDVPYDVHMTAKAASKIDMFRTHHKDLDLFRPIV